jgi:hypothetical protein
MSTRAGPSRTLNYTSQDRWSWTGTCCRRRTPRRIATGKNASIYQDAESGTCDHPVPKPPSRAERILGPKLDPVPKLAT